jgi:hypothetical protein
MVLVFLSSLVAILLPFAGVLIVSVSLLSLCKPKTRLSAVGCFFVSAVAVILGLLWWSRFSRFFPSATDPIVWFVVGPVLACTIIGLAAAAFTAAAIRRRLTGSGRRHEIKKTFAIVLVAILFSSIVVGLGQLAFLERGTWMSSYSLSNALRKARSVTFVEFTPNETGVLVLGRKVATPEEVTRFQNAISPWFLPFEPQSALCSQPHHRVEIVRADGTQLTFYVCFLCGNFFLEPAELEIGGTPPLPPSWERSLSSFFASIGMAPRTSEEYFSFDHTDWTSEEAKAKRWKSVEESALTFGGSCYELGIGYEKGELGGAPNPTKAREYFAKGAVLNSPLCWVKLAEYCRLGLGGPQDEAEAYYWISLEARCVNPNSFGGKETWKTREEIAQHLSLPVLELAWQRIDAFIAQVTANKVTLDSPPFSHGLIDPRQEAEGRRSSQKREDEHRSRLKARGSS